VAGNRGYVLKRYVVDQVAALPALAGSRELAVSYSWNGKLGGSNREIVFGGKVSGSMEPAAMRGNALQPRTEVLTLMLHIYVAYPGESDASATEARAVEIGTEIEEWVAGNPVPPLEGLRSLWVAAYEIESGLEDETSMTGVDYTLSALSYLT
jgi:hypothetical protein